MSELAIEITNLSKKYRIQERQHYFTLRDTLTNLFANPYKVIKKQLEAGEFWALDDVSFSVKQGEIMGLIGNNGAGKSTLLKILSRVTSPTRGEVQYRGRLGSLLEVGTGFHPELSGRENIFLNGAILGMSRAEVKAHFDEIVEFAGVERFLDSPMKHFSSGMYTRLAFSVAAHLTAEILLVDEVLAVGDVEFQKKCLGKMGDIAKAGKTILFVSHNMGAIQQLCSSCVVIDKGQLIYKGPTNQAIAKYLEYSHIASAQGDLKEAPRGTNVTLAAKLQKISLQTANRTSKVTVDSLKPFSITVTVDVTTPVKTGLFISIKDENRRPVLLLSSGHMHGQDFALKKGKQSFVCQIAATRLTSGRYSVDCGLLYPNRETVDFVEDALFFTVSNSDPYKSGFDYNQQWGTYHVDHQWTLQHRQ